jgi:hypothetical protein
MHPSIRCIDEEGRVEFSDGEVVEGVDRILLCTGYCYRFPFFQQQGGGAGCGESCVYDLVSHSASPADALVVTPRSVRRLYQHLLFAPNPSLAFLGLPHTIVPFPLFYLQARYLATVYASARSPPCSGGGAGQQWSSGLESPALPDSAARDAWVEALEQGLQQEREARACVSAGLASEGEEGEGEAGSRDKLYHNLGPKMWDYLRFMRENSGSDHLVSARYLDTVRDVYEAVSSSRPRDIGHPDAYRDDTYVIDR